MTCAPPSAATAAPAPRPAVSITPDLVREAVLRGRRGASSDFDLNPHVVRPDAPAAPLRKAGVLCALVDRGDGAGLRVVLTRRADHLKTHAGQVAFPGGKIDPGDPSPMAAALREAEEEIGLSPDQVEILGAVDRYVTVTGFSIIPFIGVCNPAFLPIADDSEVAEVFETPLDFLMDPRNRLRRAVEREGRMRRFYAYDWRGRVIWGATAGMLKALNDRIDAARARMEAEE